MVDVKELFGAESKSQVYARVHNLLKKIKDTGTRIFVMNNYYDYNSTTKEQSTKFLMNKFMYCQKKDGHYGYGV